MMLPRFRFRSLSRKLMVGVLLTSLAALLVTGLALLAYDLRSFHERQVSDLATQAEILGRSTAAALQFDDPKFASDSLALLSVRPSIRAGAIYNAKGALFASYLHEGEARASLPSLPHVDGHQVSGRAISYTRRIVADGEILGTVYLRADYELYSRLLGYLAIVATVGFVSLGVSWLLSLWLQKTITKPIVDIATVARHVVERRDYSLRARKTTEDEVGYLVEAFNDMLSEIGRRTEDLERFSAALQVEIAERSASERALRVSERRNRTLVEAASSVVWTADRDLRFVAGQAAWQAYTGQSPDSYAGEGWKTAFHRGDIDMLEMQWNQARSGDGAFECTLRLWHAASGAHRYVVLRAAPVLDGEQGILEWIGTIADVDDKLRAEAEIRKLNETLERRVEERTRELEATNKELEGFSYSVSHDLRSPLRAIVGYSQMLEEDYAPRLDEEGRRLLTVVRDEAGRMGRLIDDLLSFSRISRQFVDAGAEVDMTDLAREVAAELLRERDPSRVKLDIWPLPGARGDRALLRQVWVNLLSNAIKYSGTKPLSEILVTGEVNDGIAHYRVADNGVGFDMKYAPKLFGVFQRLHRSEEFEGTGVGLAIVQRIVTRHGGGVRADSRPGEGATFHFSLPAGGGDA
jgi:PAS domain S-box-containing protein